MSSFPICQVCHKQFSLKGPAPFLLPCLHVVCETCTRSAAGQKISCSTCQRDVNLTETPLQKDVIREQEILHLTIKHQPELVLCTLEDDGNQAVCWCKECDDFLCENCQMVHGNFKATRKHVVLNISEVKSQDFEKDEFCSFHKRNFLEIWDETCHKIICDKCKLGDHADHKTVDFEEAAETAKKEVEALAKEVQFTVDQHGARLTEAEQNIQSSDETCDTLTENISHTFNTLRALMDQREKELMITLQQHQEKVRREMGQKRDTSEVHQQRCQTTSDYINKTLQYSSRRDIMSLRDLLQSKTGDCTSSARAVVDDRLPLPRFNTAGLKKIKSVLAGFGTISLENDPTLGQTVKDGETQTEGLAINDNENLKQELAELKSCHGEEIKSLKDGLSIQKENDKKEIEYLKQRLTTMKETYEKEMKGLRETLTREKEERKGLYRLQPHASDSSFMMKCPRVEFSKNKYNIKWSHINTEGELINSPLINPPQTNPLHSVQRLHNFLGPSSTAQKLQCETQTLQNYIGTSSSVPLPPCGSPQYWEVKTHLGDDSTAPWGTTFLEIGLARENEQDSSNFISGQPKSNSLTVVRCIAHRSICRNVWGHGTNLKHECQPYYFICTGTSNTLHYGVVYDSARSRIAFLDVLNENIIAKIANVDSSVPLWPMFGGLHSFMSLVVGDDINMTESKKALLLKCLY